MSNSIENYTNTKKFNENPCLIYIIHRNKKYTVKYIDFTNKSSYKEVIGHIHPFEISIDDALETNSIDAFIQHIKTRNTKEIINENNIFDLNYLAHFYGFYILQAATSSFLLSKIPVNCVFEAIESRKKVDGYFQSFYYYFTHNFEIFVCDPSFYSLPFNVIEKMVDFNASELTADDIVQLTINAYYVHGKKSLSLLEKANNCKSIYNLNDQKKEETPKKIDMACNPKSKSNLRNAFYKMIDAEDINSTNSNNTNSLTPINAENNNDNDNKDNNNNNTNNNDKKTLNNENNNINDILFFDSSAKQASYVNSYDKENFSVNSDIYTNKANFIKQKNRSKRGGKILEKECSTKSLIHLYATIAKDRPYPYTQYICNILSKRKKVIPENRIQKDIEELRYNISSIYITLLETTQGNKNAAYILLTSFFESGKADFMKNTDIVNLYKNLSDIPSPIKHVDQTQQPHLSAQSSQSQLQLQQIKSSTLRFSFSFNDMSQEVTSDFDKRLLSDNFDWGAHGLYILYRIYHEGLYGQKKDENKAQLYLKRSADRNYNESYFKLANFIVQSKDFLTIREDKLEILRKAANLGNGDFQFALACNLVGRKDKLFDPVFATYYFKLAMLSGHPNARDNFERFQCDIFPPTSQKCKQLFTRITTEKIDIKTKLSILKKIADCGFEQAIIMYPTYLSDIDCSQLNPDRPMDEENQIKEVKNYMKLAIKRNMKYCHSVLGLFTLRKAKNSKEVIEALEILNEGSNLRLNDSIVLHSQLLLRMLGKGYRQPEIAIKMLQIAASYNYIPALLELSSTFLYGIESATVKCDKAKAIEFLRTLYILKEPVGSSRYLYIKLNDTGLPKSAISSHINELKSIAELVVKNKGQLNQSKIDANDLKVPAKREVWSDIPLWLYAKVMLEGKVIDSDFKSAVSMLKKAEFFPPAMVLLVSLSFQFSGIVKTGFQLFNLPLFSLNSSSSKEQQNDQPLPKNFDSSYLPLPSVTSEIIEKFANQGDPTFRYKHGSIMLDEDEDSEEAFQLIRQSAYAGSICGMMKYGLLRLSDKFRPKNEFEAIEMFHKAGLNGLDSGIIMYANLAMKYSELRDDVLQLLQLIRAPESSSERINFVARRGSGKGSSSNNEIKLRLQLGKSLCLKEGTSLQESQYHLISIINQYTNSPAIKITQLEFAEALFYYGKLLEKTAEHLTKKDPSVIGALDHFLRSYSNGFKPAIESYVTLLLKIGDDQTAIDFLLDNLSTSTFALYKVGSMTLFTWPGDFGSVIAESQAIDFMKLATMLDDSRSFPDLLWKFGTMLRDGFYVAKDEQTALSYFYEAAKCGSTQAEVAIGNQALKIAFLAERRSKENQNVIENLSIMKQNKMTAFECFRKAAQGGKSNEAAWLEAICLLKGIGVDRNRSHGIRILISLAQKNDKDALYKLGKIAFNFSKGGSEGSNSTKMKLFNMGINYIAKAAQLGHSTAIWRLGLLILQGQCNKSAAVNVFKRVLNFDFLNASSEKVATKLFEISANSGNQRGASLFSLCAENGIGIDRNMKLARLYASSNYMEIIFRK